MENYNIYDEVGRGTHSFVYKARRKRSIEYVAVKSTAKCRMEKILNEVQFLHKLDSPYVLKFYNWYESQNHIWLIFEYCIGGDLLNLITQDKRLPERAVRTFGRELVAGLQYLHLNRILFCDLKPANILVDEFGSLKLADFGLARRIPTKDSRLNQSLAPGSPNYMAPELFQQQAIHSFASDFWALGCVLYEMATGKQAFTHTVFSELARKIQTEPPELPNVESDCVLSSSFRHLLERLLHKNPHQRISWEELLQHPFWSGSFALQAVEMPAQELFDQEAAAYLRVQEGQDSQPVAAASAHALRSSGCDSEQYASASDNFTTNGDQSPSSNNNSPIPSRGSPFPTEVRGTHKSPITRADRPVSAPAMSTKPANETSASNRTNGSAVSQKYTPKSARTGNNLLVTTNTNAPGMHDEENNNTDAAELARLPSTAPAATIGRRSPTPSALLEAAFSQDGKPGSGLRKLSTLLFTPDDCRVKSVVWSDEIERLSLPATHPELLSFTVMTAEQLLSTDTDTLERYLMEIYINLKRSDMETEEAAALMAHLFTYCCRPKLANVIINSSILTLLAKMLTFDSSMSQQRSPVLVGMTCLVVGVLFRFATFFAPTSSNQLQSLFRGLTLIADQARLIDPATRSQVSTDEINPRRLAVSCLGQMLVYMSTRKEWHTVPSAWDRLISAMSDADFIVRHYAARALFNILLGCRDEALLSKMSSEQVVSVLAQSIVEYADIQAKHPTDAVVFDVWTTTTQVIAQALRYVRSPTVKSRSTSVQKCSLLLAVSKRNVIRALWRGFQSGVSGERLELSIASLNALNVFLEIKLDGSRDSESKMIELARSDLLERVVTFPEMTTVLEATLIPGGHHHNQPKQGRASVTAAEGNASEVAEAKSRLLQSKVVILLYLGTQMSREFVGRCLEDKMIRLIELVFAPLATIVRDVQHSRDPVSNSSRATTISTTSSRSNTPADPQTPGSSPNTHQTIGELSPKDVHLLQCLINLVKMLLHRALKLGAECISSNAQLSKSGTGRITIDATPFRLFESLLRSPACCLQLVHYFVANTNKHYTFFLRLATKMLADFPGENLDGDADNTTVGVSLGHILLRLFQCATTDARKIVAIEPEILYLNLLPVLADLMAHDSGTAAADNSAELSITSIRILYLVLLQFDGNEDDSQVGKYRETFVQTCLLPRLRSLLMGSHSLNENVWRFAIELLFGLLSKHDALLEGSEAKLLVPAVIQLLDAPRKSHYHSLPSSATRMAKMMVMRGRQGTDPQLYDADIARCLLSALRFATDEALGGCLMDLLEILLHLLHARYEEVRRTGSNAHTPPAPRQFSSLTDAGPIVAQLCAVHRDHGSPSRSGLASALNGDGEACADDEGIGATSREAAVADLASRCLIFLSQLFGERLNDALFAVEDDRGASVKDTVSRSLLMCLDRPDAAGSAVVLRVLLTLKNCLRCQSNNSSTASHWFAVTPKLRQLLKSLARAGSSRLRPSTKQSDSATSEQIAKTAADILRLCNAISSPRES